jgi:hypothetical protein
MAPGAKPHDMGLAHGSRLPLRIFIFGMRTDRSLQYVGGSTIRLSATDALGRYR